MGSNGRREKGDGPRIVYGVYATRSAATARSILDQVVVTGAGVQDVLLRPLTPISPPSVDDLSRSKKVL
jgi:hypothetical protein